MTLEEAIKHAEEVAKEQEELYRLCPASESEMSHCDGTEDCKTLENGKNKGCQKCAEEHKQLAEWLKDYKRLLEQQPCEDAISRQAAQAKIKSICDEYRLSYEDGERKAATGGSAYALGHAFDDLPPVTPQPKTGHWIEHPEIETITPEYLMFYECSECGDRQCFCKSDIHKKHFCNNCGAKMVKPQESEEV